MWNSSWPFTGNGRGGGRVAHLDRTLSLSRHTATGVNLRAFFDDIAVWGWPDRPPGPVLYRNDIPRQPVPLPPALRPDADTALMAAGRELSDVAAKSAIILLRGTGLRLGELVDLELDCLWDLPGHGTWVKVPLGKLNTERVVPLDETAPAALDAWMQLRGRQRGPAPPTRQPTHRLPVRNRRTPHGRRPRPPRTHGSDILIRTDSAGACHAFLDPHPQPAQPWRAELLLHRCRDHRTDPQRDRGLPGLAACR